MEEKKLQNYLGNKELNLVEAMQKIDQNAKGILYIVDIDMHLLGSVTDGDIRRWIIRTGKLETAIELVMNASPISISVKDRVRVQNLLKKYKINSIPVVDVNNKLVDVLFQSELVSNFSLDKNSLVDVPVVIMAGGKGTRLYPYTKILPKPLIPIGDIPILERIMNCFNEHGAKKYYITLNYKKNMIKSYLADVKRDKGVFYVEESMPLGTAGSLRLITEKFNSPFFVTNCDILVLADYGEMLEYHKNSKNVITIVSAMKKVEVPYGVVNAKENGMVTKLIEKPSMSYLVNTGMYVINPEVLQWIPKDLMFHMTDLVDVALSKGYQVGMYPVSEDAFLDMGEVEEMKRMEEKLKI